MLEMMGQSYYETDLRVGGTQGTELDLILYSKVFFIIFKEVGVHWKYEQNHKTLKIPIDFKTEHQHHISTTF